MAHRVGSDTVLLVRDLQITAREKVQGNRVEAWSALDAGALLRGRDEALSRVLRVILERTRAGSRPRERDDEHVVCLAIEGGGMRGAVTAGMCVVLEAAGLAGAFDRIYGVSAGALNGWEISMR